MRDESRRDESVTEHAVVIAGAGPTGLMLAAELALAQVDVALVERRKSHDVEGLRAGGVHMRTLEVFDQRGIVDRFTSQGEVHRITPFAGTMLDISDTPTRHNYFLALWQPRIERILADWVAELGVPIYFEREIAGFTQQASGVHVELSNGRRLQTRYLVGCDGGRSLVRKHAGIDFPGWDPSTSYLIAEVETAAEPAWGMRHGEKGTNAIAKLEDGKRARMVLVEPDVRRDDAPTLEDVRASLKAVYGTDYGLRSASYISRFTDMGRQAASYRQGRVLIAGDAAHVHSPIGGQGLNVGIQDAVNLGWKLAQVVHGTAADTLLDTYHTERHAVGARLLRNTMGLTALHRGDARTEALRAMLVELMQQEQARRHYVAMISGLDIQYDCGAGHPLLGRRVPDLELQTVDGPQRVFALLRDAQPVLLNLAGPGALEIEPWADRVRRIDARYTGDWQLPVLGAVPAPGAILIRPDGHVAWVGDGTDTGLREALTTWFGAGRAGR